MFLHISIGNTLTHFADHEHLHKVLAHRFPFAMLYYQWEVYILQAYNRKHIPFRQLFLFATDNLLHHLALAGR